MSRLHLRTCQSGRIGIIPHPCSLTRPPLFGLLSNLTPANEQGAVIGIAQSAGSLARILGPIFATTLLHKAPALPYLICAGLLLVTTFVVIQRLPSGEKTAPG